jgi:DNA-binding CsgD family transcriptional regulator
MQEVEQISSLIADIYDAALDPTLWTDVLPVIAEFVGGQAAGILSKDSVSKAGTAHYHFGVDPHYVQTYSKTHFKFDALSNLLLFDVDQIVTTPELVPYHEFCRGRFFLEWMQPQGWIDAASSVLEKSISGGSFLTILRKDVYGMVDDAMRRRMALVVPHVRRAMLVSRTIDRKTAEAAALADTLDGIGAGMFLVDAGGQIVHANASGQALLDERSVLRAGSGRLAAIEAGANKELSRTLALAVGADAAVSVKGIALPLATRDGERYVAHALPLTSGERKRAGAGYAATAALFVHRAAMEVPTAPEVIAKTYKLTSSELRVLLAIVQVGGVPEVAEALGLGEATVKTHLHHLFAKTETTRQAELVKLVAGFSSPLAN